MIQNILINLNILSKIKPYDKIYINKDNLITIEYNSIFQGVIRFLYNNSREKNLTNLINFYQTVYQLTDELLNSQYLNQNAEIYIKEDNDEFMKVFYNLQKINQYLESSLLGINNLKKTYNSDILTDSKLDIIINNTEQYITKISKKILYYSNLMKKYNMNNIQMDMYKNISTNHSSFDNIINITNYDSSTQDTDNYNSIIKKEKIQHLNNVENIENAKKNNYNSMV